MATLPGVLAPSRTGAAVLDCARARNVRAANSGRHASRATPSAFSVTTRAGRVRFTVFTTLVTIGIPANLPTLSVDVMNRSAALAPCALKFAALPRSIKCGKSTFHGCGGTYGHL